MRTKYPLLSQELNDIFQEMYYNLVYILGYDDENNNRTYIGEFDKIEQNILQLTNSIMLQLDTNNNLSIKNPVNNNTIPLYNVWGHYIAINELRRK